MTIAYQRILVPLDGSELAARALPHAETIATMAKAKLTLLQVIPSAAMLVSESTAASPGLGMPTVDPFLSSGQYEAMEQTMASDAQATLEAAAAPLRASGLSVETVILKGAPADAILAYTTENQFDLIVMSTHGRGGLARVFFGSVAESIVHRAQCPVLLVRVASE